MVLYWFFHEHRGFCEGFLKLPETVVLWFWFSPKYQKWQILNDSKNRNQWLLTKSNTHPSLVISMCFAPWHPLFQGWPLFSPLLLSYVVGLALSLSSGGFGSCLVKEWDPNSPHWEEKANNSVMGASKTSLLISCLQKILKPKCWSTLATSPNWIF